MTHEDLDPQLRISPKGGSLTMERMTPKDAAILELEDDVSAAHGLTVGIFEGPEPKFEELLERIADRIALVPRYRQRLVRVPFGIERPVWVMTRRSASTFMSGTPPCPSEPTATASTHS